MTSSRTSPAAGTGSSTRPSRRSSPPWPTRREAGALLVTCRYPLPGPDRFLARIPVPPLSPAELRRLFLRLPALRDLGPEDRRLLIRAIGGHPRLIEFTDALLRGGHASLRHVQVKLRDLARREAADLAAAGSVDAAVEQAMLLGSADILLEGLLACSPRPRQAVLRQVAVCRAPMTLDDLAFALARPGGSGRAGERWRADAARLADLTLLKAGEQIVMHPWTAELVTRNASTRPERRARAGPGDAVPPVRAAPRHATRT